MGRPPAASGPGKAPGPPFLKALSNPVAFWWPKTCRAAWMQGLCLYSSGSWSPAPPIWWQSSCSSIVLAFEYSDKEFLHGATIEAIMVACYFDFTPQNRRYSFQSASWLAAALKQQTDWPGQASFLECHTSPSASCHAMSTGSSYEACILLVAGNSLDGRPQSFECTCSEAEHATNEIGGWPLARL